MVLLQTLVQTLRSASRLVVNKWINLMFVRIVQRQKEEEECRGALSRISFKYLTLCSIYHRWHNLECYFFLNYILVGARDGIFGLIGACLAEILLNWGLLFNNVVNVNNKNWHMIVLVVLILYIVVNSLIGLTPFVDNFTREYMLLSNPFFVM